MQYCWENVYSIQYVSSCFVLWIQHGNDTYTFFLLHLPTMIRQWISSDTTVLNELCMYLQLMTWTCQTLQLGEGALKFSLHFSSFAFLNCVWLRVRPLDVLKNTKPSFRFFFLPATWFISVSAHSISQANSGKWEPHFHTLYTFHT